MNNPIEYIHRDKLKQTLITRTAIKTLKSESVVEVIINHSFKQANKKTKLEDEIEISGFGVFMLSQRKLQKCLRKRLSKKIFIKRELFQLLKAGAPKEKIATAIKKINNMSSEIEELSKMVKE